VRAVLDANIWVRGFLRGASYPGQVVDAWRARLFILVSSEPLLEELADVLARPAVRRKTGLTADQAAAFVGELRDACDLVAIPQTLQLCRDPDDDVVIETAILGNAAVIVSQDEDLLSMVIPGLSVLTAPEFLDLLAENPAC
jgi:putative PIN family toxin of toxin-antitoxin system